MSGNLHNTKHKARTFLSRCGFGFLCLTKRCFCGKTSLLPQMQAFSVHRLQIFCWSVNVKMCFLLFVLKKKKFQRARMSEMLLFPHLLHVKAVQSYWFNPHTAVSKKCPQSCTITSHPFQMCTDAMIQVFHVT